MKLASIPKLPISRRSDCTKARSAHSLAEKSPWKGVATMPSSPPTTTMRPFPSRAFREERL